MGHGFSCLKINQLKPKYVKNPEKSKGEKVGNYTVKAYEGPPGSYTVRAKYKYEASGETDISFDEKEIMYVIKEYDDFWLQVIKHNDKKEGFVPLNYVSVQDGSPQSVDAWREIQRWEAEKLLMRVGLKKGTYIIRPSKQPNCFALSVRDVEDDSKICIVKHFQIKTSKDDDSNAMTYFITIRHFPDILTLINHYEENGIGNSHVALTDPLPDDYQPPKHFLDIEINRDNIELLGEIGRGHFGSVQRAKWGRAYEVAAKMMQSSTTERDKFLEEAKIMHKLRHRKIVELLGVCTEPADMPMLIIVEYMKKGSLKDFLRSTEGSKVTISSMVHIMADICEGMSYLESQNVVHRDLRADNVLVADNLTVKVADFGLTQFVSQDYDGKDKQSIRFPYKWTAPEAARTKIFTAKSDIWSFGVVMYEIVTWGSPPYPDIPTKEVIGRISEGYRMPNPRNIIQNCDCPDNIYKMMTQCWSSNPEDRPTFEILVGLIDTYYG